MTASQTMSAVQTASIDGTAMAAVVSIAIILVVIAVVLTVYIIEQTKADEKKQSQQHQAQLDQLKAKYQALLDQLEKNHQALLNQQKVKYQAKLDRLKAKYQAQLDRPKKNHQALLKAKYQAQLKAKNQAQLDRLKAKHQEQLDQLKKKHQAQLIPSQVQLPVAKPNENEYHGHNQNSNRNANTSFENYEDIESSQSTPTPIPSAILHRAHNHTQSTLGMTEEKDAAALSQVEKKEESSQNLNLPDSSIPTKGKPKETNSTTSIEQAENYEKAQPRETDEESPIEEIEVTKENLDEFRRRIEKFCKNVVEKGEFGSSNKNLNSRSWKTYTLGARFKRIWQRSKEDRVDNIPEKNRYGDKLPYKDRIVLLDDVPYISASYVCPRGQPDQHDPKSFRYIAAQGPLKATIVDFWTMTLRKSSKLVVMLCQFYEDENEKCAQYFPEEKHKEISVINDNRSVNVKCSDCKTSDGIFIVRKLDVTLSGENGEQPESSTVTHIQFLKWPDKGIPVMEDFFELFIKYLELKAENESQYPDVIHCTAGVSRTGTFITFEVLVSQFVLSGEENQPTSLIATIEKLRKDRISLVQKDVEYKFIYDALFRLKSEDRMMSRIVYFYEKVHQMEIDLKIIIGKGNKSEFAHTEFTLKWSEPTMSGLTLI